MTKDHKFMELAYARARFSKDTSTKVGAVIIGAAKEDRSSGYNGAPRGCAADEAGDLRSARPEKYFWFSHAELNAITNAGAECANYPFCTIDPNVGTVAVPDERLDFLAELYKPKKYTPAATNRITTEANASAIA